jgi:cytoskeletal protein RodZ
VVFFGLVVIMGKKKKALIALSILCLAVVLVLSSSFWNTFPATAGISDPEPNSQSDITTQTPSKVQDTQSQTSSQSSSETQLDSQPEPPGAMFVVPESPLGTLGLFGVVAAACGLFALKKKAK